MYTFFRRQKKLHNSFFVGLSCLSAKWAHSPDRCRFPLRKYYWVQSKYDYRILQTFRNTRNNSFALNFAAGNGTLLRSIHTNHIVRNVTNGEWTGNGPTKCSSMDFKEYVHMTYHRYELSRTGTRGQCSYEYFHVSNNLFVAAGVCERAAVIMTSVNHRKWQNG